MLPARHSSRRRSKIVRVRPRLYVLCCHLGPFGNVPVWECSEPSGGQSGVGFPQRLVVDLQLPPGTLDSRMPVPPPSARTGPEGPGPRDTDIIPKINIFLRSARTARAHRASPEHFSLSRATAGYGSRPHRGRADRGSRAKTTSRNRRGQKCPSRELELEPLFGLGRKISADARGLVPGLLQVLWQDEGSRPSILLRGASEPRVRRRRP